MNGNLFARKKRFAPFSGAAPAAIGGIGLPFVCGAGLSLGIAVIAWRPGAERRLTRTHRPLRKPAK